MKPTLQIVLLLILLAPAAMLGGTTGKIVGHVKDSQTNESLAGVNVLIQGTTLGASSDVEGFYTILNIPPGSHTIIASAIGYIKKSVTGVSVSVDLTTTLDLEMAATVVEVSPEIVITAERPVVRKDLTSSEAHVDAGQIHTLPVSEVSQVLALQSGITVDAGGGIHIRGGRTSEVAYWVDGVSVSDVYDGHQAVQVENNAVQELQVISGTFNAEYGQAMSGIVNIVTKDGGSQYHGNLSSYTGSYATSDGWKYNGAIFYVDPTLFEANRASNELFYNLNSIRPFDDRDIEGSLSGPVPGISQMTFYASARYLKNNGWLYGDRLLNTDGTPAFNTTGKFILDPSGAIIGVRVPDNPVPMNDRERISGQAKLTYQFTGTMKLSLSGLASKIDYRDYSQDWQVVPDGDVRKYDRGYEGSALWTHSLNSTSFYTINLAFFRKGFKEYLYENPLDPRYLVDPNLANKGLYEFNSIGTNLHHFQRLTETRDGKIDYTSQINRLHEIKVGVEGKLHRLYLEDYNVAPAFDARGNYIPAIPSATSPLYQEYTQQPIEFSGYVQDKLEYERMIVNLGVRYDYFNSKGLVPADPNDPNIFNPAKPEHRVDLNHDGVFSDSEQSNPSVLAQRLNYWYRKASAKHTVSPRFGISYPITDKGILHFSYGHFLQIPSFINLYQNPGYKVTTQPGVQGVYGNPDLDAQKTVMYEIGLQQQLSEALSFDVTGFYRDVRDWVTTSAQIPLRDPATATTYYTMYVNRDYANSRGITLTVNKRPNDLLSLVFSYTFQVAEGNNSNPDDEQAALLANKEPSRTLTPLDWDQTHTANLTMGIGRQGWGVFVLGRYGSGLPYTPVINQAEARGVDAARTVQVNSRRRPETYTVDLRAFKNVGLGPLSVSLFLKVFNLFDRRNEVTVYGQTGRASATPEALGAQNISGTGRLNPVDAYLIRPDYYSEPREVQVGAELEF
jgi:carboxypeptidase-like protein/TonB-dependent receptor-like protein/outer membrane beta-barrel protein